MTLNSQINHCPRSWWWKGKPVWYLPATVQFSSHSVKSDTLRPHGLQHARPPCPSLAPGAYVNSCPSSQWCHHPTISSSVIPLSFCLQPSPSSGSFPISQFFTSGGQSVGVSASASNEYSGLISFRIDWLDHLAVQGTSCHMWVLNTWNGFSATDELNFLI